MEPTCPLEPRSLYYRRIIHYNGPLSSILWGISLTWGDCLFISLRIGHFKDISIFLQVIPSFLPPFDTRRTINRGLGCLGHFPSWLTAHRSSLPASQQIQVSSFGCNETKRPRLGASGFAAPQHTPWMSVLRADSWTCDTRYWIAPTLVDFL